MLAKAKALAKAKVKHIYSTGVIYDHHLQSSKYFYSTGHRCFPTISHGTLQVVRNRSKSNCLKTFLFEQKDFETSLSKFCCSSDFVTKKNFFDKKKLFFRLFILSRRHDIQHDDTQQNVKQHNDIQRTSKYMPLNMTVLKYNQFFLPRNLLPIFYFIQSSFLLEKISQS